MTSVSDRTGVDRHEKRLPCGAGFEPGLSASAAKWLTTPPQGDPETHREERGAERVREWQRDTQRDR